MCNAEVPSQDWYVTEDDRFALTGTGMCFIQLCCPLAALTIMVVLRKMS